jgi:hypothetical protein
VYPKNFNGQFENTLNENVLLHLPINSSDLTQDCFGEQYLLNYTPIIKTPAPYDDISEYSSKPYPFTENNKILDDCVSSSDNTQRNEINISVNELDKHNPDNEINNIKSNDNEINNIEHNNNEQKGGEYQQDNISYNSNKTYDINGHYMAKKENNLLHKDIKIISDKSELDALYEQTVSNRNQEVNTSVSLKNRNLPNNMNEYIIANRTKSLPKKTSLHCRWDGHPIIGDVYTLPIKKEGNIWYCYGSFSSPECAAAWCFFSDKKVLDCWESYALLNVLYPCTYKNNIVKIKCAPEQETLRINGGPYSCEQFRELNKNYNRTITSVLPPLISTIPQMEEIYIDIVKQKNNYVPVDTERIKKANNDLKLKRSVPVINSNNTLENCMNLKCI